MAHNKLVNLRAPSEPFDAATKDYADYVKTKVEAATKEDVDRRPHIILVHAYYHGPLIRGKYQFTFEGNESYSAITGFFMPHSGRIKKIKLKGPLSHGVSIVRHTPDTIIRQHLMFRFTLVYIELYLL